MEEENAHRLAIPSTMGNGHRHSPGPGRFRRDSRYRGVRGTPHILVHGDFLPKWQTPPKPFSATRRTPRSLGSCWRSTMVQCAAARAAIRSHGETTVSQVGWHQIHPYSLWYHGRHSHRTSGHWNDYQPPEFLRVFHELTSAITRPPQYPVRRLYI
jgi:hypothetical protein